MYIVAKSKAASFAIILEIYWVCKVLTKHVVVDVTANFTPILELLLYLFEDLFADVSQLEEKWGELFDRGARVSDPGFGVVRDDIRSTGQSTKTDRYLIRYLGFETAPWPARLDLKLGVFEEWWTDAARWW